MFLNTSIVVDVDFNPALSKAAPGSSDREVFRGFHGGFPRRGRDVADL
jgi:hypothetical protein